MTDHSSRTFSADFKRFFLRGLVVLLPTVLTLWIVVKAYQFVDNSFAHPINKSLQVVLARSAPYWKPLRDRFDPDQAAVTAELLLLADQSNREQAEKTIVARLRQEEIVAWWESHWYMQFIGLFVAIIGVYVAGRLLGGFFGRRIYRKIETVIITLPVIKQVYPYVKQVVDFLFSDEKPIEFSRVVVVEYPRKGIWSVGFQTGPSMKSVAEESGDSVSIFVPSSPTPFTGYTITVPRSEVRELPITVEEAIRFAVSGGVLIPEHQLIQPPTPPKDEPLSLSAKPGNGNNDDASHADEHNESQPEDKRRDAG